LDLDAKMQKRDFRKNAIFLKTKQFRAMVSIVDLCIIGLFKEPIIGSLKSKMAEIRHLGHDTIFGPIWIKFRRLVHNDMSTAVMWSKKSKPDVEFQYGGRL